MTELEEKKEKIIKDINRKARSFTYLREKYDIDNDFIINIIAELKKSGDNVHLSEEDGDFQIINFQDQKIRGFNSLRLFNNNDTIKFLLISDTRLGSKSQQLSILNDLYLKAEALECDYVFHLGDISEGMYKGRYEIFNESLFVEGVNNQAAYIIEAYPSIERRNGYLPTYFLTGEHDESFVKKHRKDIGNIIDNNREDMFYLNPMQERIEFCNNKNNNTIVFDLIHGDLKQPYTVSYHLQQKIDNYRSDDKVDVLAFGHELNADALYKRNVHGFMVPSVCANTPEMIEKNLSNTVGGWIVTLRKDKNHNLVGVTKTFIPYYKTKEDDYIKARVLKKKRRR